MDPVNVSPESSSQAASSEEATLPAPVAMIEPEVIAALEEFVAKCQKSSPIYTGSEYQKLETFFGKQPVPVSERVLRNGCKQVMQVLDEWDIPEAQKKQRITKSLRGPASEAFHNLKLSKLDCTAHDYLDILQDVFGRTEMAPDLMYQFEHTY